MKTKVIKGKKGEDLAVDFLEKQGVKIIERNWRYSRMGEIDIIANDENTLVFVEVKTRATANFGHPIEAVSPAKFNTMQQLAEIYISNNQETDYKEVRFDIIGILLTKEPEITHIKGIYE